MSFNECFLIMVLIEIVLLVSRKNVDMKMPDILMPRWFIMLSCGSTITIVSATDCDSHLLDGFVDFGKVIVGNVINIFGMPFRYYQYMPRIINPPLGSNKCHGVGVLINDVFWSIVFIRVTGQIRTKWANVILWLMVKHVLILPYGGIYEYQDPTIKYLHIIYDDSFRVRSGHMPGLRNSNPDSQR